MAWIFVAKEKDFSIDPEYKYVQVLVYYGDDEMPIDAAKYKENGRLRLTHAGWESLKAMIVLEKDVVIREE